MASPTAASPARSEKTPVFRALAATLLPPMNLIAKLVLHDEDKVPATGAFILAPNHFTEIDPVVMGIALWKTGRAPRFLAKASLFKIPVVGSGQVPVDRVGSRGSDPLAAARRIADDGLGVIIYPEGSLTRDPDLWPMRGKTGAVRMALETGIPLIPAAHWGTQKVMPRYARSISVFPRKRIDIVFGDPVDLSAFRDRGLDAPTLNEATDVVMQAITALVGGLRGETAPAERWDPTKNKQSETGRFDRP
jgi:1-acyl-sn-glycerol-3-phosphate acyltransferase